MNISELQVRFGKILLLPESGSHRQSDDKVRFPGFCQQWKEGKKIAELNSEDGEL